MDRTLSNQEERSDEAVGQGRAAGLHRPLCSRAQCPPYRSLCDEGTLLLIDGVLVPAEVLINSTTITRYEAREFDELEFFHIKLESHDVIYAEGAPAETLLNVEESAVNFAEYLRQYGTAATDEDRCAPHIHIWGGRIELMSRVRSALSPWIDLRNRADVVRDQLEERGLVDSRQFETVR
jgi:Hint domain